MLASYVLRNQCISHWLDPKLSMHAALTWELGMRTRAETGSGHLGRPDHILPRSSGSDPLYKIFGPDPDSGLDHMC